MPVRAAAGIERQVVLHIKEDGGVIMISIDGLGIGLWDVVMHSVSNHFVTRSVVCVSVYM